MTDGTCLRCRAVGPIEQDHPDGRYLDVPVIPAFVAALCKRRCHLTKGRMDRAAGVEGGLPTIRVVIARRAAWVEFLASEGQPIQMPALILAQFSAVLQAAIRQLRTDIPRLNDVARMVGQLAPDGEPTVLAVQMAKDLAARLADAARHIPCGLIWSADA
jgi:hypothetical protein